MASKASHAALIWNKQTAESGLWSLARNKRSSSDLKASNHQLIPDGSCRPWSTVMVFIVWGSDQWWHLNADMWEEAQEPYFLSAWFIATYSWFSLEAAADSGRR